MKDATAKLLEKAEWAIAAGESSLRDGHIEAAVSRAYYAMFHVAQGLLNQRDLRFRKHGGVQSTFGEHLVKTGEFDPRFHRQFLAAFNKRIAADYGVKIELTTSEAEEMLAQAQNFLDAAHRFLKLRPRTAPAGNGAALLCQQGGTKHPYPRRCHCHWTEIPFSVPGSRARRIWACANFPPTSAAPSPPKPTSTH